jgi:hypothetical protein
VNATAEEFQDVGDGGIGRGNQSGFGTPDPKDGEPHQGQRYPFDVAMDAKLREEAGGEYPVDGLLEIVTVGLSSCRLVLFVAFNARLLSDVVSDTRGVWHFPFNRSAKTAQLQGNKTLTALPRTP